MAGTKTSALTSLTTLADGDVLPVVDISDTTQAPTGSTKKTTAATVAGYLRTKSVEPSVVNALDHVTGDGTNETAAIQTLLTTYTGRHIFFPPPPVSYTVATDLAVGDGTVIYGVGPESLFTQTGTNFPLFNLFGKNGCTVRDIKASYTGVKEIGSSIRGGAAFATNSVVWTNGNDHKFQRIISDDFACPIRIDNWDGATRTSRPTNILVDNIVCNRPDNGVLVSGAMGCTFRSIKCYDVDAYAAVIQAPHAVYVTNEGALSTPYMEGNHFEDLFCDGVLYTASAAFQFKALLGGRIVNIESINADSLLSIQASSDVELDGASGRELVGSVSEGAFYTDLTPQDRLTIRNVTLRFVAAPGIAANRAARIIGNDVTIDGLDIVFPADTATTEAVLFGSSTGTADYKLSNVRIVNTNAAATAPRPVGFLNITGVRGRVDAAGFLNTSPNITTSSGIAVSAAAIGGSLSGTAPSLLASPGEYWSYPVTHGLGATVDGSMYTLPFYLPRDTTFDRIGAEVTTLAAGSTVTLGLYADNGFGYPGTLILDAGTIDGGSATAQEKTINVTLRGGSVYHTAALVDGGAPTLRMTAGTSMAWTGRQASLANALGTGAFRAGRSQASISGFALPATAATSSSPGGSALVALRVV